MVKLSAKSDNPVKISDNSDLPSTVGQTFLSDRIIEQTKMSVLPFILRITVILRDRITKTGHIYFG